MTGLTHEEIINHKVMKSLTFYSVRCVGNYMKQMLSAVCFYFSVEILVEQNLDSFCVPRKPGVICSIFHCK